MTETKNLSKSANKKQTSTATEKKQTTTATGKKKTNTSAGKKQPSTTTKAAQPTKIQKKVETVNADVQTDLKGEAPTEPLKSDAELRRRKLKQRSEGQTSAVVKSEPLYPTHKVSSNRKRQHKFCQTYPEPPDLESGRALTPTQFRGLPETAAERKKRLKKERRALAKQQQENTQPVIPAAPSQTVDKTPTVSISRGTGKDSTVTITAVGRNPTGFPFRFPDSFQPVFDDPINAAAAEFTRTYQRLDTRSGNDVLTITPIGSNKPHQIIEVGSGNATTTTTDLAAAPATTESSVGKKKKKKNRAKQQQQPLHPCCELRGKQGLQVICPHSAQTQKENSVFRQQQQEANRSYLETARVLKNLADNADPDIARSLQSINPSALTISVINQGTGGALNGGQRTSFSPPPVKSLDQKTIFVDTKKLLSGCASDQTAKMSPGPKSGGKKKSSKQDSSGQSVVSSQQNGVTVSNSAVAMATTTVVSQPNVPIARAQNASPSVVSVLNSNSQDSKKLESVSNGLVNTVASSSDAEKLKAAQLKAERKAAFEAKRAAELAAAAGAAGETAAAKSKAELKAERRALQEAQRLAKAAQQESGATKGGDATKLQSEHSISNASAIKPAIASALAVAAVSSSTKTDKRKQVSFADVKTDNSFFALMYQRKENPLDNLRKFGLKGSSVHPEVLKVGFRIAQGLIVGSNARCSAMMTAFKQMINEQDFLISSNKRLSQEISTLIDTNAEFLRRCRPLSVSMTNALSILKAETTEMDENMTAADAKRTLCERIDLFLHEELDLAKEQIAMFAQTKIHDDDVILTYGCSSLVKAVLQHAKQNGCCFRVVVVDSRPKMEGREMLKFLNSLGIRCTYVLINAISYVINEVNKVLMGAHSLLANGYVTSRVGSAQIALVARSRNVPVLVCCETYKFSERVYTDSFAFNELGSVSEFGEHLSPSLKDSLKDLPARVMPVSLTYDVTPPEFVAMVITEKGMLPCTSVPVVLRVRHAGAQ